MCMHEETKHMSTFYDIPVLHPRENAILHKQQNINRYVHAYFRDDAEITMELESIDLMLSDQKAMPVPIKKYREYMKERKKEAIRSKQK